MKKIILLGFITLLPVLLTGCTVNNTIKSTYTINEKEGKFVPVNLTIRGSALTADLLDYLNDTFVESGAFVKIGSDVKSEYSLQLFLDRVGSGGGVAGFGSAMVGVASLGLIPAKRNMIHQLTATLYKYDIEVGVVEFKEGFEDIVHISDILKKTDTNGNRFKSVYNLAYSVIESLDKNKVIPKVNSTN